MPATRLTRDALITLHLPLVERVLRTVIVRLHHTAGDRRDELRSAGYLGLVQAADRFDHRQGVTFKTFAWPRIEGAMVDELRDTDIASRSMRTQNKAGFAAEWQLQQELGREPARAEIAARLGMRLTRYERIARIYNDRIDSERVLATAVADVDLDAEVLQQQRLEAVMDAIATLPLHEQRILVLYYFDDLTMKEIGVKVGRSESRVSQLHERAVNTLRGLLGLTRSARPNISRRLCPCPRCQKRGSEGRLM